MDYWKVRLLHITSKHSVMPTVTFITVNILTALLACECVYSVGSVGTIVGVNITFARERDLKAASPGGYC